MKLASFLTLLLLTAAGCATMEREPDLPGMIVVTGTAHFEGDFEPSPRTILQVRVVNSSLGASKSTDGQTGNKSSTPAANYGTGFEVLAESIAYPGTERPFPFTLEVPPVLIDKGSNYEVVADLYISSRKVYSGSKPIKPSGGKDISGVNIMMSPVR